MGMSPDQQELDAAAAGVPPLRRIVVGEETPPIRVGDGYSLGGNGYAAEPAFPAEYFAEEPMDAGWFEERMRTESVSISFGQKAAVKDVSLPVNSGQVLALIGPSGCGKTTLLRSLNKLVDLTPTARRTGRILLDGEDTDLFDDTYLRKRVGMLFQQPNPFPMSIFDNIAYGLRERGSKRPRKKELEPVVIDALERAGLWNEVSDNLDHPALSLSGGQQQRLCIARSLAVHPEVLLLDEPCSALDPMSTAIIEETIVQLKDEIAIVIVTHNLQQAERVADQVAFMYMGDLVEYGSAEQVFNAPLAERTKDYVRGDFG
jgi:phosphate transport system ATP-binding protein